MSDIRELALQNLMDIIPNINNTGERVNSSVLRLYERNAAVINENINQNWNNQAEIFEALHATVENYEE